MKLHPDRQWGGGDVTWAGAHEFDVSVDVSTALYVDGSAEVLERFHCFSNEEIVGDLSVDGTCAFGGDVSVDGTLCAAQFLCEGTAVFASEVDISGNCDVSGALRVSGDVSGKQFVKAWASFCGDGGIDDANINDNYNVNVATRLAEGVYEISYTDALADANYCLVATAHSTQGDDLYIQCVSKTTDGARVYSMHSGGADADCSQVMIAVFGA